MTAEGVPKLLDFGIAKLLGPQAGELALTRTGERLMTPEYASPEQMRGDQITTAADVYALGVLLYELLAGRRPFQMETKSPLEVAQIICEQVPEPPSRAITGAPVSSAPDAARRVKGDLDNIVLMAMRKEPSRRYSSVGALSGDVQAYLTGYSVEARTDTWRYRGGKFVRRHKVAVPMAILALLALIGFSVAMGLLARRANRERRIADQQRLAAQHEADFLASIFDAATPAVAKGNQITARELLDQGAKRIDAEFAAAPDLQATMLYNIGDAYGQLGLREQAQPLLERAYDLRKKLFGDDSLDVAKSAIALAKVYRLEGQYAKSEALLRQALLAAQKAPGENNRFIAEVLSELGFTLFLDSQDSEAETLLRKSLSLNSRQDGYRAFTQSELALVLRARGDVSEAWLIGSEAVQTLERLEGPDTPEVVGARNNLNGVLSTWETFRRQKGSRGRMWRLGVRSPGVMRMWPGPWTFWDTVCWLKGIGGKPSLWCGRPCQFEKSSSGTRIRWWPLLSRPGVASCKPRAITRGLTTIFTRVSTWCVKPKAQRVGTSRIS